MRLVLTAVKDRIGFITLNRPEKRNALSPPLVSSLKEAFEHFRESDEVKIIVLGANGKAFCAGADLTYLQQQQGFSKEENVEDSRSLSELFRTIYEFPKVVIASVQGHAIAGGCGLASVCDFILTVPEAKFGYTEARIGFVPAIVSYFLIKKIGEAKAREYLLSGDLYDAVSFSKSGLIYHVEPNQEALKDSVIQLASKLVNQNSSASMKLTKELLTRVGGMELNDAMEYAAQVNANARSTEDCVKGIGAFLSNESLTW